MRSFPLFLPFLQALDTTSPPDLFKVHLVVFQTFSVLLHLTGLPLWPSWKARHRSRGPWLSSMERLGRRCRCNAQAGRSRKCWKHYCKRWWWDGCVQPLGRLASCNPPGFGFCSCLVDQESVESTVWRSFQMTLCFNMRYTALDSWSDGQKTILRLFQVVQQNWKMEDSIELVWHLLIW